MATDLEAVVFDVDGTLVDSERDGHRVAFNRAFAELGLEYEWDPELYGRLLAIPGGRQRLDGFLADEGVEESRRGELVSRLHERKTDLFVTIVEEGGVGPRPGATELVAELSHEGIRMAVATTGTGAWVRPLLARLFGDGVFEAIVTHDEVPSLKPDPAAYIRVLETLSLTPGPAVVAIEDSGAGVAAAKTAAMSCVVVANDYTLDHDFTGAELVLDGFGGDRPPAVLNDPLGVAPRARLDASTLGQVARLAR